MLFASPIWLALLLPWLGVVLWLLRGRGVRSAVPFLDLWRADGEPPRRDRSFRLPSIAVLVALVAILLAIFAAAGPVFRRTVFRPAPTATTVPSHPQQNVGITRMAMRRMPTTQMMISVRNDSDAKNVSLAVKSASTVDQSIDLPSRGQERNYFLNPPAIGRSIEVRLEIDDDYAADNHAALKEQSIWPKVEVRSVVAPQVRRVIEAYQSSRPSAEGGTLLAVVTSANLVTPNNPAVIVVGGGLSEPSGSGETVVTAHPLTVNVNFPRKLAAADTIGPGTGWSVIASIDGQPLVAVRESSARQVWIGFDDTDLARTADFVIFWTNVLDWVGSVGEGGAEVWVTSVGNSPDDTSDKSAASAGPTSRPANPSGDNAGLVDLRGIVALLSLACLACAAVALRGRNLTVFSPRRTV